MTKKEFIEKIEQKYKDTLDFSKLENIEYNYQDRETKIRLICNKHGEFERSINNSLAVAKHISGYLCPHCAKEHNRRSLDEWIKIFKERHGDRFDYSLIKEIENNMVKLPIVCRKHNHLFYQNAHHHLYYEQCCPICKSEIKSKRLKYSLDDFIRKAHKIHGDKYDYSKVEYVDSITKVCIICPKHGEFWQTPALHLKGQGCPKCGIEKNADRIRKNTDIFIEQARKIHGDKYDYSKVRYVEAKEKVCIICPVHGEFWQTPDCHINGKAGCKKCATDAAEIINRKDKEWFIERARKVHSDKYDYSKVEYVNCQTKVCIVCPEHGEFWQTPNVHLQGGGCRKCRGVLVTNLQEFIEQSKKVHGDKYDYSKVEYVNSQIKVCIVCPEHGEFWQTPNVHLRGDGCPVCGAEQARLNRRKTTEEFIEQARKVHGDKYDYSKVEYTTNTTEVCIICPKHGEFWQLPTAHLSGSGCQRCRESKLEKETIDKLFDNNIAIERQKGFKWLRYYNPMKLDFYLPEYNVAIECQGIQHFKKIEHFEKKNDGLEKRIRRDKKKKELCDKHGIKIFYYSNCGIEYPYKVYEDLDELLKEIKEHSYFETAKGHQNK